MAYGYQEGEACRINSLQGNIAQKYGTGATALSASRLIIQARTKLLSASQLPVKCRAHHDMETPLGSDPAIHRPCKGTACSCHAFPCRPGMHQTCRPHGIVKSAVSQDAARVVRHECGSSIPGSHLGWRLKEAVSGPTVARGVFCKAFLPSAYHCAPHVSLC